MHARAVQLSVIVFVVSVCAALSGGDARLGLNLWTAQAAMVAGSLLALLRGVRKLI